MRKITFNQLKRLVRESNHWWEDDPDNLAFHDKARKNGEKDKLGSMFDTRYAHFLGKCKRCGGKPGFWTSSDAGGHETWGHIECADCGASVSAELSGPDEDRSADEIRGILMDRWEAGDFDDGGKAEYEVKEEAANKESSYTSADMFIDQIYRMIEAGDARRALSIFNRKKNVIAKEYPGALRELESLINDNL